MSVSITIGGGTVNRVSEVSYGQDGAGQLGTATFSAANTSSNRGFSYGEEVIIKRNGTTEFVGVLEQKPSAGGRNLLVEFKARDKRAALHYEEVHRPYYEQDTGAVIRESVNKRTKPLPPVDVFQGDDLSNWSSDADVFSLANIPSQALYDRGTDLFFLYWEDGASGEFTLTYTNVPTDAAPFKQLLWLETRYLFNNAGSFFQGEVELRDDGGNSYVWDMGIPDGAVFNQVRYPAQAASSDNAELSGSNKLEYRINITGALPEPRAAVIDYGRTRPFGLQDRGVAINAPTSTVPDTGREITRRFDRSLFEVIQTLSVGDGTISYVDESDDLHYENAGSASTNVAINHSSTRVVDATFNRDATQIVNRVRAEGKGDLTVSRQASGSIQFYGVSPRDRPLVDKSIQNKEELTEWADGYLDENAWSDEAFSFVIADRDYRSVSVGEEISVNWSPEDIGGDYIVSSKQVLDAGKVELSFTGSGA